MDCENFEYIDNLFRAFIIFAGFFGMTIAKIINWIYSFIEQRVDTSIEPVNTDGTILFHKPSADLFRPWVVFYQTVFSSIGIRLILLTMSLTTNNHCEVTKSPNESARLFFEVFVGFLAYFIYFIIVLDNVYCHIESHSRTKNTTSCKSVITTLMEKYPTLVFTITYYIFLPDGSLYDQKVKKERFIYQRCEDATDLTQLKRPEEQINTDNPVLLTILFSIICGDTETRSKYLADLESFIGPLTMPHPLCPREFCIQIDPYGHGTEMLVSWDTKRNLPWWMSKKWFWVCTFLLLGVPYKILFDFTVKRKTIKVKKVIYCNAEN